MKYKLILCFLAIQSLMSGYAQSNKVNYRLNVKGEIESLIFYENEVSTDTIQFRQDSLGGPSLWLNDQKIALIPSKISDKLEGVLNDVHFTLAYIVKNSTMTIQVTCNNKGKNSINPVQLSLRLGLNTSMEAFPQWNNIFFPTLLRCEKTHFWGYFMSPKGQILTISSPDPVASYRMMYNNKNENFASGHLIKTVSLDLLNPLPLPERNPQNEFQISPNQTKTWTINIEKAWGIDNIIPQISRNSGIPIISSDIYTYDKGESAILSIFSINPVTLEMILPNGKREEIEAKERKKGEYIAKTRVLVDKGIYTVYAHDSNGKTCEAKISVRDNFSNYIKSARRTILLAPPKASSHTESWYSFFTGYIAREYFPERGIDEKIDILFNKIYPLMYDTNTSLPTDDFGRIQNHACMASVFVQKYKVSKNINDLRAASKLLDFLMTAQTADGAYRNGKVHYTSVIYIAKSFMEVMSEEKKINESEWQEKYIRHYSSVKRAIDELAINLDNIQTEGEQTFEDGMIGCSSTQLSQFALLQPVGSKERKYYTEAAKIMENKHRCLSQILIPDTRMNGGSLRFWEAQYDILTYPNMMNSPHGWTAWQIYAMKNLYELTGDEYYLRQMKNGLGACLQLLDPDSDKLNWAFVCDPYVNANIFVEDSNNKGHGKHISGIIGEQYMPMISTWYRAPIDKKVTGFWGYDGGCCDNDVHEIFKCLGEIVLPNAYIHQHEDGSFLTWNCAVNTTDGKLIVTPLEKCVNNVYFRLNKPESVKVQFANNVQIKTIKSGWVTE